jgi:YegS/Rv2252/BmrU family lipid kinase
VSRIAVIINPISGTGGRIDAARDRVERAAALAVRRGVDAQVMVTERPGHARELTRALLAQGVATVVAWGGDGTVNEVASALAFREATLGIIPSGSGNGLARELHIPSDPEGAFEVVFGGRLCRIDAGEFDGKLFFNIAGVGLDARVAHRFAADRLLRRGFRRYVEITAQELFRYRPDHHTVVTDGTVRRVQGLIIAVANARQYGNGALIAPAARVDDGRLDVVVVPTRPLFATLLQVPRLFTGGIARVPGVSFVAATNIEITSARPVVYHVDGEPHVGGAAIAARPHARALRVLVPNDVRLELLGGYSATQDLLGDC